MVLAALVCATSFKTTLMLASDSKSIKVFIRNESNHRVTILDPDEHGIQYDLKLVKRRRGREPNWIIACGPYFERKAQTVNLEPKEVVNREYDLVVKRQYSGSYVGSVSFHDDGRFEKYHIDGHYETETYTPVGKSRIYKLKLDVTPKGSYKINSLE